jgi:hypothetical protein
MRYSNHHEKCACIDYCVKALILAGGKDTKQINKMYSQSQNSDSAESSGSISV